jgi:hypothetical protein
VKCYWNTLKIKNNYFSNGKCFFLPQTSILLFFQNPI